MTDSPGTPQAPLPAPNLSISQILLEEVSFRHVGDFLAHDPKDVVPENTGQAEIHVVRTPDKDAIIRLRLASTMPERGYQYNVSYLVIFKIHGATPEDLDKRLAVTGANMAMPFVRELVANLTGRGRFGPRWISPMNFNPAVSTMEPAKLAESPKLP